MGQFNIRDFPEGADQQLNELVAWKGYTKTQIVLIALDRFWRSVKEERKDKMSGTLEYNSNTGMYEANVDGKQITVSVDELSEVEAEHIKTYTAQGLSAGQAEKKAWEEARWAGGWVSNGYEG